MVRSEHGAAEGADDGLPVFPVERHVAEARSGLHVGDASAAAAAGARAGRRLAPADLLRLIDEEAEADHC